jgi:hypothetical protein
VIRSEQHRNQATRQTNPTGNKNQLEHGAKNKEIDLYAKSI